VGMINMSQMRLGQINYVTKPLGTVAHFEDTEPTADGFTQVRLSGNLTRARLVRNNSGGTLGPSLCVKYTAGKELTEIGGLAGANEQVDGLVDPFLTAAVPIGATFWIIEDGLVDVTASAAISAGASIKSAASGKVVTTTFAALTDVTGFCGRLVEQATADNQKRRARFKVHVGG